MNTRIVLFLMALVMMVTLLFAQPVTEVTQVPWPGAQGELVSDGAGFLDASSRQRLNESLWALQQQTGIHYVIALIPSLHGQEPRDFANQLFAHWGIGEAGKDNGLLLMVVFEPRSWTFETGYGVEHILPDVVCARIGQNILVPLLRAGEIATALERSVEAVREAALNPDAPSMDQQESGEDGGAEQFTGGSRLERALAGLPLAVVLLLGGVSGVMVWSGVIGSQAPVIKLIGLGLVVLACALLLSSLQKMFLLYVNKTLSPYEKYEKLDKVWGGVAPLALLMPLLFVLGLAFILWVRHVFRYAPRFTKDGRPMRLLDEHADDAFLESGAINEELLGSANYDVWIAESPQEIALFRFKGRKGGYSICPYCSYQTMRHNGTTIQRAPTYEHSGLAIDHHVCFSCNKTLDQERELSRKTHSSSSGSSGRSSSFSSSRSSGSSFGGGRSGGGGASGSW